MGVKEGLPEAKSPGMTRAFGGAPDASGAGWLYQPAMILLKVSLGRMALEAISKFGL